MRRNTRRADRSLYKGEIIVQWEEASGGARYAMAKCVDISKDGVSLNMHQAIPAKTFVTFRIDPLKLSGRASVRHCAKRGGAYFRIGLEFSAGLKFAMFESVQAT